jgi:RimJ/RimL family protein N-acetyltransferase
MGSLTGSQSTGVDLVTERLLLRPWRIEDAEAALEVYREVDVARWLDPVMDRVPDLPAMRLVLQQWISEADRLPVPAGRWAIEKRDDGTLLGGVDLLPLPPDGVDLEMTWQLRPDAWGQGYATAAGRAVARWAFDQGLDEVFAVARSANERALRTARRIGMDWVGETDKYHGTRLQVFRLRPADLL